MVAAGTKAQTIHARQALLSNGWAENIRLTITGGKIAAIEEGVEPQPGDERQDVLLAGMPNLHSHAFQYGMAGLAERRGPSADSFWSWRDVMYRFAHNLTPDQARCVATRLYVDMLEAGFTRVGEFHYLHHDRDGREYGNIAEMAVQIAAAARDTGIGLTLLPVFYAHSNFGGLAPNDGQRRFINSLDRFAALVEGSARAVSDLDGAILGVAPHSLRAVTPQELSIVAGLLPDRPVHIHIAEQMKEVNDCLAWSGQRPVEWLLANQQLSSRWCLIHATHMTDEETRSMALSGAIAGLCPVTEANLGDGTFSGTLFRSAGGQFGIGSDSNVLIGIGDELRQLEYSQRLAHQGRNMLADDEGSTGRAIFDAALTGGNIAMGCAGQALVAGAAADVIALDVSRMPMARGDTILDTWLFTGRAKVQDVWVHGRKQVHNGRHHLHEAAERAFQKTLGELLNS